MIHFSTDFVVRGKCLFIQDTCKGNIFIGKIKFYLILIFNLYGGLMVKPLIIMRNTLNDVIALVENVIVTGKNNDWGKVSETAYSIREEIWGVYNLVTESGWNNVYMKMLDVLETITEYNVMRDGLSVDESYIVYLQKLMDGLKTLNEIKYKKVWC